MKWLNKKVLGISLGVVLLVALAWVLLFRNRPAAQKVLASVPAL